MSIVDSNAKAAGASVQQSRTSASLQDFLTRTLCEVPHRIEVRDWSGASYDVGGEAEHWSGDHLQVRINEESAGRLLLKLDVMGFLERFLEGDVDLEGNLYLLPTIRAASSARLNPLRVASNARTRNVQASTSRATTISPRRP